MADDGHVLGSVSGSQAGAIVVEGDVEYPVECVLDLPVGSDGLGEGFGAQGSGGDEEAGVASAAIAKFGACFHLGDGGEGGGNGVRLGSGAHR